MAENDYYHNTYGCGERTWRFLSACKHSIGLVGLSADEALTIDNSWHRTASGPFVPKASELYWTQSGGQFIAAYQMWAGRAIVEHRFIFDRRPTSRIVREAYTISEIELDFRIGRMYESFTCRKCGYKVRHWLDVIGSLDVKYKNTMEKYCGC
jgi:hypothetical protein